MFPSEKKDNNNPKKPAHPKDYSHDNKNPKEYPGQNPGFRPQYSIGYMTSIQLTDGKKIERSHQHSDPPGKGKRMIEERRFRKSLLMNDTADYLK